jgi:hypothetical protein
MEPNFGMNSGSDTKYSLYTFVHVVPIPLVCIFIGSIFHFAGSSRQSNKLNKSCNYRNFQFSDNFNHFKMILFDIQIFIFFYYFMTTFQKKSVTIVNFFKNCTTRRSKDGLGSSPHTQPVPFNLSHPYNSYPDNP